MTLIVLLILAGITLSSVLGQDGIFERTETAGAKYNEAKAREILETVLLADGQYEKNINHNYNQDEFLDELIKNEIPGTEIKGDVAIIGEWAFELDRTVPKIGRTLGKADKLIFPTVEIISGPTLIENGRKATFKAKATETTKGITRIELWLDGKRIEKETKTYETPQTETVLDFEVNKNGKYTVKAYADLMASATEEVTGIVPTVSFSPNGSTEWKKQHTTKVTVEETAETITGLKYLWVKDDGVNEPAVTAFIEDVPENKIITGGNDTMTGTYYLWILLTIGTGSNQKTSMSVSQGFNFDNEGPTVTKREAVNITETTFQIKINANDNYSEVSNYKVYLSGKMVQNKSWDGSEIICDSIEWSDTDTECYVVAMDSLGNIGEQYRVNLPKWVYEWNVYKLVQGRRVWFEKSGKTVINTYDLNYKFLRVGWNRKFS